MTRFSTISSKGQITIPREIRLSLGLREGDRVEFVIENGQAIIRAERPKDNPFLKYLGILPPLGGKRKVNEWAASLRDEDRR